MDPLLPFSVCLACNAGRARHAANSSYFVCEEICVAQKDGMISCFQKANEIPEIYFLAWSPFRILLSTAVSFHLFLAKIKREKAKRNI